MDGLEDAVVGGLLVVLLIPDESGALTLEGVGDPRVGVGDALDCVLARTEKRKLEQSR